MQKSEKLKKSVGNELAAVLPQDSVRWWKRPALLRLNISLMVMFLFSSANGYDGSMMNGLQALPQWQEFMNYPKGEWLGFINAVQALGSVFAYPVVAWLCNYIGRKRTVGVGYLPLCIGTALQTAAPNTTAFIFGRLFIGFTSAFFTAAPLLMTETAYPTHRAVLTALYNTGWYVGSLLAAWVVFGTRNHQSSWAWRIPSILQAAIPALAFIGYILCPDSPRWLMSVGREDEARAILSKYHAEGDEQSPLACFEFEEIKRTIAIEKESQKSTGWLDLIRGRGNQKRTLISVSLGIFSQWCGVGIASYYLAPVLATIGITSVTDQTMISGFLQLWNLILAVGAALCVDKAGRRRLFMTSCLGMLACYILITGLSGSFAKTRHPGTGVAVIPFLFLFYGFYDIAFTPLLAAYACEIWQFSLRARGLSLTFTTAQLAVFFNVFVNPIALEAISWKYYIVYCMILVGITAFVYFVYPETKGHSLEEMDQIFNGDEITVPEDCAESKVIAGEVDNIDLATHLEESVDRRV